MVDAAAASAKAVEAAERTVAFETAHKLQESQGLFMESQNVIQSRKKFPRITFPVWLFVLNRETVKPGKSNFLKRTRERKKGRRTKRKQMRP